MLLEIKKCNLKRKKTFLHKTLNQALSFSNSFKEKVLISLGRKTKELPVFTKKNTVLQCFYFFKHLIFAFINVCKTIKKFEQCLRTVF